jgi:hypothetical protein
VGHWLYIHGDIAACHVNVSLFGAPQHAIYEQFANYSKIKILSSSSFAFVRILKFHRIIIIHNVQIVISWSCGTEYLFVSVELLTIILSISTSVPKCKPF